MIIWICIRGPGVRISLQKVLGDPVLHPLLCDHFSMMNQCVHWTTTWTQNDPTWFIYWSRRLQKQKKTQRFSNIFIFAQCHNVAIICLPVAIFLSQFAPFWDPFFFHPTPPPYAFSIFSTIIFDDASMHNMNPKWPNMVHILEAKASKWVQNITFFQYFIFGQCHNFAVICVPMGTFVDVFGTIWDPFFVHPTLFFLSGRGGCVTIFRWCINACIGRQHEPKMTQHGLYIGAQGFKNSEKNNVFQTFSFLLNVTMLLSYVSPWPLFWTSVAPFGTPFSSTPPPPYAFSTFSVTVFDDASMHASDDNMKPKTQNDPTLFIYWSRRLQK